MTQVSRQSQVRKSEKTHRVFHVVISCCPWSDVCETWSVTVSGERSLLSFHNKRGAEKYVCA